MNISVIMLMVACLLFRYLAGQARTTFYERLAVIFRTPAGAGQVFRLLRENPGCGLEFRRRALPFCGGQIALDGLACAVLVMGVWWFPPEKIAASELSLLQGGSLLIVVAVLAVEGLGLWQLWRLSTGTESRGARD